MSALEVALIVAAGFGAGAVNGIAGGGTLVSFPALLAVGLPALRANLTSTVGIFPGFVGGIAGFREEIADQTTRVAQLSAPALAGSVAGAVLLLTTPARTFESFVPYLVLGACALFALQPLVSRSVRVRALDAAPGSRHLPRTAAPGAEPSGMRVALTGFGTFVGAVYGGYFGAGLGVMLLALLGMMLPDRLVRTNGLRSVIALVVSTGAVAVFLVHGDISWADAGLLAGSSLVGGYSGARLARRLPAVAVRIVVIALGLATAIRLLVA